jgi:hypothetical protein
MDKVQKPSNSEQKYYLQVVTMYINSIIDFKDIIHRPVFI